MKDSDLINAYQKRPIISCLSCGGYYNSPHGGPEYKARIAILIKQGRKECKCRPA